MHARDGTVAAAIAEAGGVVDHVGLTVDRSDHQHDDCNRDDREGGHAGEMLHKPLLLDRLSAANAPTRPMYPAKSLELFFAQAASTGRI